MSIVVLSLIDLASVALSRYSKLPPMGIPLDSLVTFSLYVLRRFVKYKDVASPSALVSRPIITSSKLPILSVRPFMDISSGPMPSSGDF